MISYPTHSTMKIQPTRIATPSSIPNRHRGFTLVELLVVITIIGVLAALTMAVTQNLRGKAYLANSMSSMRQVAAMNVAYYTENNGDINTLRFGGDPKEGGGSVWVKNTYWGRLQPYLFPDVTTNNQGQLKKELDTRLDGLFNTKDAGKMVNTALAGSRIYHDTSGLPVPFAFNSVLAPWGKFVKASSVQDPTQLLYFTYGFGMFNKTDGQAYEPMPPAGSPVGSNIYFLKDKKALGVFLDGHVESLSPQIPDRYIDM